MGLLEGLAVGAAVGLIEGLAVGAAVGLGVGFSVGSAVGLAVGLAVGAAEQKQRTREARPDGVYLAVDHDLRVFAVDLRAPRLSISRGKRTRDCADMPRRPESLGTVIFAHLTTFRTTSMSVGIMPLMGNVPLTS